MILNMTGGGGTSLNFAVVGGTTQPENPKENTIWVDTSTAISEWVFSAEQPANPVEGMVWFQTGTSAPTAFNALKKNNITVYPTGCVQYANGAWNNKTAKIYQSGMWLEWVTYIYKLGDEYIDITGGWADQYSSGRNTLTKGTDYLMVKGVSGQYYGSAATKKSIDLTHSTTLRVSAKRSGSGECWVGIATSPANNAHNLSAKTQVTATSYTEVSLDVSAYSGNYYVLLCVNETDDFYANELYLW